MGQKCGKAQFHADAVPFLNLPSTAIEKLWTSFELNADGWGLSPVQFAQVCSVLAAELNVGAEEMDAKSKALFALLDTDMNDAIDSLEFLATMALVSGMSLHDKMQFSFNCYDFAEAGALQADELTLMFKSTVAGLCKLSSLKPPELGEFEALSKLALTAVKKTTAEKLAVGEFLAYCEANPTTLSWMAFYDDIDEAAPLADAAYADLTQPPPARGAGVVAYNELADMKFDEAQLGFAGAPCEAAFEALTPPRRRRRRARPEGAAGRGRARQARPAQARLGAERRLGHGAGARRSAAARCSTSRTAASRSRARRSACLAAARGRGRRQAEAVVRDGARRRGACLAASADGSLCATGEVGARPKIVIWKAEAGCKVTKTLHGFHTVGVKCLAFSADGAALVSVGADAGPDVAVHDVASGAKLFCSVVNAPCHAVCFAGADAKTFVTASPHALSFWSQVDSAGAYERKQGVLGAHGPKHTYVSVCALDAKSGLIASGSAAGAVHVWAGRNCACVEPTAHAGADGAPFAVEALFYLGAQSKLASGGADGKVKIWKVSVSAVKGAGSSVALGVVSVLDLMNLPSAGRAVRSVCLSGDGNKALVHTAGAEVWELSTAPVPDESGDPEKEVPAGSSLTEGGGPLMLGAASAVDAMLPAPTGGEFVTGSADGTVRAWDLESHRSVRAETIPNLKGVASFGFNAGGDTLAVGFGDGKVKLLKFADLSEIGEIAAPALEGAEGGPAPDAPACAVKFSPDGQSIGVACGSAVTLYEASGAYGEKGSCKCGSAVTAFDFSEEPGLLALSTAGLELLFYSLETFEPVAPLEARDRAWFTKSVPLATTTRVSRLRISTAGPRASSQSTRRPRARPRRSRSRPTATARSMCSRTRASSRRSATARSRRTRATAACA